MTDYDAIYTLFYDHASPGLPGDVEFYVDEAREVDGPVLELGCGAGRILIPTAEAGVEIVGLDCSASMLAVARQRLAEADADARDRAELVQSDMRRFALRRRFALVTIPYRAFIHLLTPEDQLACLGCVHEHLAPGGRLVLNTFDPRLDVIVERSGPAGGVMKRVAQFPHPQTGNRVVMWETGRYDPQEQTFDQVFVFEELDAAGRVLSKHHCPIAGRYTFRWEMHYLLSVCGFQVDALYSDFDGAPYRYGAEQIWVASKA